MRVEPFGVDSIVHITKRGARGADIVHDDGDRLRFVRSLFYLNDTHADPYWHKTTSEVPLFDRPAHWPEREPLVRILAWTLLSNHFHLLVQEIREEGTARFMQRLCGSMSMCANQKYKEKGSLFQGSYHGKTVSEDVHFNYLTFYILVKNVLEMYPGGLPAAQKNFDAAWHWAMGYAFSSLQGCFSGVSLPIIDDPEGLIVAIMGTEESFKSEAKELLDTHISLRGAEFSSIMLEPW